jgi:hypothetical protein
MDPRKDWWGSPPWAVHLRGDERVQRWMRWGGPRTLCWCGGICVGAREWLGYGVFTPLGGLWCCGDTTAKGPAWRWSSEWGGVFFLRFSFDVGSHSRFFDIFMSAVCGWVLQLCFDFAVVLELSGETVLIPQSNRLVLRDYLHWRPNPNG